MGSLAVASKERSVRVSRVPPIPRYWIALGAAFLLAAVMITYASHFDMAFSSMTAMPSRRIPTSAACTTFLDFSLMHGRSAPEALRAYLECNSAQAAVLSCAVEVARAIANHTGNWGISVRTIGEGI